MERMNNPIASTYDVLIKKYNLSCPNVLVRCFVRTVSGRHWKPGSNGGSDSYLSELDMHLFKEKIKEASDEINCITHQDAEFIAVQLKSKRIMSAANLLIKMKLNKLLDKLEIIEEPSSGWIHSLADDQNMYSTGA